jgi:hypothetical protein
MISGSVNHFLEKSGWRTEKENGFDGVGRWLRWRRAVICEFGAGRRPTSLSETARALPPLVGPCGDGTGSGSRGPKSRKGRWRRGHFASAPAHVALVASAGRDPPPCPAPAVGRPEGRPSFQGLSGRGRSSPPREACQITIQGMAGQRRRGVLFENRLRPTLRPLGRASGSETRPVEPAPPDLAGYRGRHLAVSPWQFTKIAENPPKGMLYSPNRLLREPAADSVARAIRSE